MKAERFFVLVTFEKVLGDGDEHCLEDEVVSCASRWSWDGQGGQGGDSQSTVVCLLMCSSNPESFRLRELLKGQHSRKTGGEHHQKPVREELGLWDRVDH